MKNLFKALLLTISFFAFSASAGSGGGLEPPTCKDFVQQHIKGFELIVLSDLLPSAKREEATRELNLIKALRYQKSECEILEGIERRKEKRGG